VVALVSGAACTKARARMVITTLLLSTIIECD
jgi:hypothetical protein